MGDTGGQRGPAISAMVLRVVVLYKYDVGLQYVYSIASSASKFRSSSVKHRPNACGLSCFTLQYRSKTRGGKQ